VHKQLGRAIHKGRATLRVDVNGGWEAEETPRRVEDLRAYGVCAVEQPVFTSAVKFVELAQRCPLPLIADESLISENHAKTLLASPEKVWWNLRLSKNGGLLTTLRLMKKAHAGGVTMVLGCMVGESSILAAAQRRLLQLGPVPRFVEGNYGRFLLRDDLLGGLRSLRFGFGGALRTLKSDGLGVDVSEKKLARYATHLRTLRA
jgi:L-alanine-DL-glutamate epimerase-like enolase superfamily enzyme